MNVLLTLVVIFRELLQTELFSHLITGNKSPIYTHVCFLYLVMLSHHIGGTVNMDIVSIEVYRPDSLAVGQIGMLSSDTVILFAFRSRDDL